MKRSYLLIICFLLSGKAGAQVESSVQVFSRGMLWHSVSLGKIGPNFNNWARRGIGLDWPGFEETWVQENIGGAASHLATGGFWVGAKKFGDSIIVVEDWSIYAGTISNEPNSKYRVTKHRFKYKNGENYWLRANPDEGEEVIETSWEYNLSYTNEEDRRRQLPLRVNRSLHQWSGSRRNENYVITEYVFKNISPELRAVGRDVPDTLYGFYLLLNYAMHANSRSWNVLFPARPAGAHNTWLFYDPSRRMMYGRAGNFRDTPQANEEFGFSDFLGPINDTTGNPSGEWLAPGYVGVRLLYSTPDSTGQATRVNGWGWAAATATDLSGPFTGIGGDQSEYQVISNPARATNFVSNSFDSVYMQRARMWSMMSLGPWRILPGDSVVVALAEAVDGVDYRYAVDRNTPVSRFAGSAPGFGFNIFNQTMEKARFTYEQKRLSGKYNHPDPPAAPAFSIDYDRVNARSIANIITWGTETESLPDPDDGIPDLVGYRLYRSTYLPIGPWDTLATITKGNTQYFDGTRYTLRDSSVKLGVNYYYALTAFDSGRSRWTPNSTAIFPETGSNRVPSLESSIFANRMIRPFKATTAPSPNTNDIVVVPNPFVSRAGFAQPSTGDEIQFVNVPNPCTIRIYTIRGDLVATINQTQGAGGIAVWNQVTDFGQFVESGVYIYHIDSPTGTKIGKFAIIR